MLIDIARSVGGYLHDVFLGGTDTQSADAADIYQKALPMYEKQGAANRLTLYRYRTGNGLTPAMRYNAYNWLDSWLQPF